MIGTIRPSWKSLKCFGVKEHITATMCRTCNATAQGFGQAARLCLSHDMIFLGLFSRSEQFFTAPLRRRPLQCISSRGTVSCPDAQYLAAATVFTAVAKINDAILDREIALRDWAHRKIHAMDTEAERQLARLGLPIERLKAELHCYGQWESRRVTVPFSTLSRPIADAYGMLFEHLPSQAENTPQRERLREIGRAYGELTLLVDAVEDAPEDRKKGRFNVWQAASDLPRDKVGIGAEISRRLDALLAQVRSESQRAASYLEAAREATLLRLSGHGRVTPRLLNHPVAIMLAGINCCEQDCFGDTSLTPTGMCIAVLACAGCIFCCKKG